MPYIIFSIIIVRKIIFIKLYRISERLFGEDHFWIRGDKMSANLGNLKKINVREIWSHEALEFTPWLAKEENIAELGKAIGLELVYVLS